MDDFTLPRRTKLNLHDMSFDCLKHWVVLQEKQTHRAHFIQKQQQYLKNVTKLHVMFFKQCLFFKHVMFFKHCLFFKDFSNMIVLQQVYIDNVLFCNWVVLQEKQTYRAHFMQKQQQGLKNVLTLNFMSCFSNSVTFSKILLGTSYDIKQCLFFKDFSNTIVLQQVYIDNAIDLMWMILFYQGVQS